MTTAVLLPALPPESARIEIPESMDPEESAKLLAELGQISTEIATSRVRNEERQKFLEQRFRAIDARIGKLEKSADVSSAHDVEALQRALDKRDAEFAKWKWWALGIAGSLFASALTGLVVYYLASRG